MQYLILNIQTFITVSDCRLNDDGNFNIYRGKQSD